MKKRLKVAVLMGGKSPEHEISLISGREVVKNLNPQKYDVLPIIISRDGITWQIGDKENFQFPISNFQLSKQVMAGLLPIKNMTLRPSLMVNSARGDSRGRAPDSAQSLDGPRRAYGRTQKTSTDGREMTDRTPSGKTITKIDIVFIAMHGPYGEDGTIQGFLELVGLPYTGSGVLASALGMDKISSRKLFTHAGLKVPSHLVLRKSDSQQIVWQKFKPPVFVKPHNQGSSVGTTKVRKRSHLKKALNLAFSFSHYALVEQFIDGIEITCPILGNDEPQALPLVEIVPKKEYFDYQAKYDEKLCDEIVPARIEKSLTKKAQNAALCAYQSLGCRGFGRVDMIAKDNEVYVLEVNTIPGLTPVSLVPKSAAHLGISYPALLDKIIQYSLER